MGYSLSINPQAHIDVELAYEYYYNLVSPTVAENFYADLQESYDILELNPYYEIRVKNYRALPLKKFPFLIFFKILEELKTVKILTVFHSNQDTNKYPS